jgi:probable HAF family extracellular repeat protein
MIGLFVIFCMFLFGESESNSTRYVVTDLGVLPEHQNSRAFSVNISGVVVGGCTQGFVTQHAFVCKAGGQMMECAISDSGAGQTVALGVNSAGDVCGTYCDVDGVCRGWILKAGNLQSAPIDIGTLGGNFCAPYAMNDKGAVVGFSHTSDYKNHAFLWSHGVMKDLFPCSDFSLATDINNLGQVVGFFQNNSDASKSFLREVSGKIVELPTLGGDSTSVSGINDRGQVVGSSYLASGYRHAFLFENGVMRDLGTLVNESGEKDTTSEAFEINNYGIVIGESVSLGAPEKAFVWSRAEGMRCLQGLILRDAGAPTFHLERVSDISDSGQIVGWGYFGEKDKEGNTPRSRAVLLTPVPCPQRLPSLSTKEVK